MNRRDARRERNRADYERATQARVAEHPSHMKSLAKLGISPTSVGSYAGNTLQEHLEDQMKKAVTTYRQHKVKGNVDKAQTARGIVRGLAIAILAYENSYSLGDPDAIKAIEKEFLK